MNTRNPGYDLPGAFVASLDFELMWGVRDRVGLEDPYLENLRGTRAVIPGLLELFAEFKIAATWATVGFLFATSREELELSAPDARPRYVDPSLSPYDEPVGKDEIDDPLHFAPSLVDAIRRSPLQEVATHTFSHFYCLEAGQDEEAFRADLTAARTIAERRGIRLRSIVFPRNQHNPAYDAILIENGITAYRGNPSGWAWQFADARESSSPARRVIRFMDAYVDLSGPGTTRWAEVLQPSGLSDVRASRFLSPFRPRTNSLERIRLRRILAGIRHAAWEREIFHLWWHPHNFGVHTEENLVFLRSILDEVERCRRGHGMLSLSMAQVDDMVREVSGKPLRGPLVDAAVRQRSRAS